MAGKKTAKKTEDGNVTTENTEVEITAMTKLNTPGLTLEQKETIVNLRAEEKKIRMAEREAKKQERGEKKSRAKVFSEFDKSKIENSEVLQKISDRLYSMGVRKWEANGIVEGVISTWRRSLAKKEMTYRVADNIQKRTQEALGDDWTYL